MIVDILLTIHFILLILISLRVLSRHDLTSSARLAWIVILFILPYFGVLIYWMFGEVHLGHDFGKKRDDIIQRLHTHSPSVLGHESTLEKLIKPAYQASLSSFLCLCCKSHWFSYYGG